MVYGYAVLLWLRLALSVECSSDRHVITSVTIVGWIRKVGRSMIVVTI